MRDDLPTGTVTFLFTDVEGSTKLLHSLGADEYADALAEHRRLIRAACAAEGGVEVDTQGDAFFFAFPTAPGALAAAEEFMEALAAGPIQVRAGLHTGTPLVTDEGYVGDDVHFAARVAATSHGGQVILSQTTARLIETDFQELGEHRLKDIEQAVPLYQVGEGSFPPLRTISNTNLPRPASSFLGREAELAQVLARLQDGARLVTLTGPGGTGKTRLALEAVATLVGSYKAGVFWIGLASLRDPALVTETIAQTLGAKDGLAEHIGEREMLLLIDNVEHLVEAAPELASLLEHCPNLTILCTSRELLRVRGEVEYLVPPLVSDEAIALFCARSLLDPSREIGELCSRLDALPLAVELAAARTKALTPAQILDRLSGRLDLLKGGRDADPRQQTLRATIEWSYELLASAEQALFARLSVFAGGCTLEAAEEVCDADLDTLQSLLEKSLLRFTTFEAGGRYWMLETIREYAAEVLNTFPAASRTLGRHRQWLLGLAREAQRHIDGPQRLRAYERLDGEEANVRAALARSEDDDLEFFVETPGLLWRYWAARGHSAEGQRWLEAALARVGPEPSPARELLLAGALWMAYDRGDYEKSRTRATERLAVARALGDQLAIARSLSMLGSVSAEMGDFAPAIEFLEESVALAQTHRDASSALSMALHNLGATLERAGDGARAREVLARALAIDEAEGNIEAISVDHHSWAGAALLEGDYEDARFHLREALMLWREYRVAEHFLENAFVVVAVLAQRDGKLSRAACLLDLVERFAEEFGRALTPPQTKRFDDVRDALTNSMNPAELESVAVDARDLSLGEAVEYALASLG